jgi:hypothetical protein
MAICGCVMVALLVTALRAAPQSFDVAFIKPNYESFDTGMHRTPGRLTATASVKGLISIASDMPEFRVTGGPAWAGSLRFAIIATTPMYALVVAKGGVKLSPPTTDSRAGLTGVNVAPSMLEEFLTQELWRPVRGQTISLRRRSIRRSLWRYASKSG